MKTLRAVITAAIALALSAPASAADCRLIRGAETPDDPADDVQVCHQDVWFHGPKAGNLAAVGHADLPTWNTTKPTAAIASGGGSAYAGNSVTEIVMEPYGKESGPVFVGTFTGNLDTLAVDMYLSSPDSIRRGTYPVRTRLEVDGVVLYAEEEGATVPATSTSPGIHRIRFAYRDLYDALALEGKAGSDVTHTVKLSVLPYYFVTEAVFLYDAADVPSGMTFNASSVKDYSVLNPPA